MGNIYFWRSKLKTFLWSVSPIFNRDLCICIFSFGEYNSKPVNVSGINIFRAQFQSLKLRKEILNATNIYLFGIIFTKCKFIYRSFVEEGNSYFMKHNFTWHISKLKHFRHRYLKYITLQVMFLNVY